MKAFAFLVLTIVLSAGCTESRTPSEAERKARAEIEDIVNGTSSAPEASAPTEDAVMQALRRASESTNRDLPRMVDRETRAETTLVGPGRTYTFASTLVNYQSSELTQRDLHTMFGDSIRLGVCTADFMQVFIRNDVKIIYSYRGNDGGFIGNIVIMPTDCRQQKAVSAAP